MKHLKHRWWQWCPAWMHSPFNSERGECNAWEWSMMQTTQSYPQDHPSHRQWMKLINDLPTPFSCHCRKSDSVAYAFPALDYGKPWVTLKALWMTMMMSQDDERQESHNNVLDAIIFVWLTSPFTLISFSPEPHHRHLCFLWQEAWQEDYLCLCLQSLFSLLVFPVI